MVGVLSLSQPGDTDSIKITTLPRVKIRLCKHCGAQNGPEYKTCPTCSAHLPSPILVYPLGLILREKYEIVSVLGHGAMGTVYRGRHQILKRDVALKFIHPHLLQDEKQLERFRREAVAASSVEHPNALRVLDIDETEEGSPFLVTEFLEGRDLDQCLRAGEEFPPERISRLLCQALDALSVAHENGLVHRDLKPHNLFLVKGRDQKEQIKIVDFGLAKLFEKGKEDRDLTTQGTTLGTPFYMSPEQVRGGPLDARSDLWAVGVLLYQLLTKTLPFSGENPMSTAMAVLKDEIIPPSKRAQDLRIKKELEALCLKALSREREKRPQSAAAFKKELLQALDLEENTTRYTPTSLIAFPASTPPEAPLRPKISRRPSPLLLGAGLGIALLLGVALLKLWPSSPSQTAPPEKDSLASTQNTPSLPTTPASQETPTPEPSSLAVIPITPVPKKPTPTNTKEEPQNPPRNNTASPPEEKRPPSSKLPDGRTNLSYGKELFIARKYAKAIPFLKAATRERPSASTYLMLGDAYSHVGQTAKAKAAWQTFLKLAPKNHSHIKRVEIALDK